MNMTRELAMKLHDDAVLLMQVSMLVKDSFGLPQLSGTLWNVASDIMLACDKEGDMHGTKPVQ